MLHRMNEQKPESIRNIGLIIAIFSGLIILSNAAGAIVYGLMGTDEVTTETPASDSPLSFMLAHYVEICVLMVALGFLYLYGALNLRRYYGWASKLVSAISLFLIIFIWTTLMGLFSSVDGTTELKVFRLAAIASAVVWSVPLALLIWYLNRENIKKHFL